MDEWISMKKPPDNSYLGKRVITCVKKRYGKPFVETAHWWGDASYFNWQDVTHWMPLPDLPAEYRKEK